MKTWQYHAQKVALDQRAHASGGLTIAVPVEAIIANFEAGNVVLKSPSWEDHGDGRSTLCLEECL
jgi:hypothetical protein